MEDLTLTLIQTKLHWEQIDANLAMLEEQIQRIQQDSDLVVLPEMFSTGFSQNASKLAEPPEGKTFKWMRLMAKRHNVAVTGSYIIKHKSNRYYNRMYFVHPQGTFQYYDKRHLFSFAGEHENYAAGDSRTLISFRGWKILIMICYDLRFPVWVRSQKTEKSVYEYDLLLFVANWPSARIRAWDSLLETRAIENLSFCAGVNRVGNDPNVEDYPGHSAIYDFEGNQMTYLERDVGNLSAVLKRKDLMQFRERYGFQNDADRFHLEYPSPEMS